ncbi:MAG: STAS domain-containing protein, partial [Verrucomicrobiota bacterium]
LGNVAWVQVDGAASHENAGSVKQFLVSCFDKGWRRFVIDLNDCSGVDSTFIGVLYRMAAMVSSSDEGGSLEVINPGERNHRSISKLGLDHLIKVDEDGEGWQRERELVKQNLDKPHGCDQLDKSEQTQLVLEAHEALIAANEENQSRFCDVVEFLKQDLEAHQSDH